MIFPSGLDLTHLSIGPDFVASLLDAEAWEAVIAEAAVSEEPLQTVANNSQPQQTISRP